MPMFLHQTLNSVYSVWGLVSFVYFLFFFAGRNSNWKAGDFWWICQV